MPGNPAGYIHAAKNAAIRASVEARTQTLANGHPCLLRVGKILAQQANDTFQVGLLDDSDAVVATVNYVGSCPSIAHTVGEIVWLVQFPGRNVIVILASAGGSGCVDQIQNVGLQVS